MFDQVRRTSAADIAGATVLAVTSITAPSELNSRAGVTSGALCLVTQNVAGANEWTLYAFDATSSASVNSPYILAASGSGQWIAVTGKFANGSLGAAAVVSVDIGTANGARPSAASPLSNSTLTAFAADGQFPRVWGESYGNTGLVITGRAISGTRASPTAAAASLGLFAITATGYDGSAYLTAGRAQYGIFASTLWTASNHETHHEWKATPSGSTTNTTYMQLRGGGRLLVGTSLPTDDGTSGVQVNGRLRVNNNIVAFGGSLLADYSTGGATGGVASTIESNANAAFWSSNYYYNGANDVRARAGGSSRLSMDITTGGSAGDITLSCAATSTADSTITFTTVGTFKTTGLTIAPSTASTSPTTGALIVTGGVGISGATYHDGLVNLTTTSSGLTIAKTTSTTLVVSSTQASTTTTTGCATFAGGVGIVGAEWVGGLLNVAGVATLASATAGTSGGAGALVVSNGGAYVAGKIFCSDRVSVLQSVNTTANVFDLKNDSTGNAAITQLRIGTDFSSQLAEWNYIGSGYSSSGLTIANSVSLVAQTGAVGGLIFNSRYSAGLIRFGVNDTLCATINAASTASTSTTSGTLVIVGGVGISGQITFDGGASASLRVTNAVANATTATIMTNLGPAAAQTTIQGWLRLSVAGTDRFMPFW